MPVPPVPDDLHEWISLRRSGRGRTWVFDVTFLRSRWTLHLRCRLPGRARRGPAPELAQGCCSYGAHFIDDDDVDRVDAAVERLERRQWQFRKKGRRSGWLDAPRTTAPRITRVVDGACIFLNRPGFPGGAGCALHHRRGGRRTSGPWTGSPTCAGSSRCASRSTPTSTATSRRRCGSGSAATGARAAHEFHWWCTESGDAFVGGVAVYVYLRDEIVEMVGQTVYDQMAGAAGTPEVDHRLPHPAVTQR